MITMEKTKYVTLPVAAKIIGCSYGVIYQRVRFGEWKAKKTPQKWVMEREYVEELRDLWQAEHPDREQTNTGGDPSGVI